MVFRSRLALSLRLEYAATVDDDDLEGQRRAEVYIELVFGRREICLSFDRTTNLSDYVRIRSEGSGRSSAGRRKTQAIRLYSDRKNPDYRNSIKESISAVEAAVKIITEDEKATLGQALTIVQQKHNLHAALKEALSRLYGYTSDEEGIRHAILEGPKVNEADARFMLVICSAFANYLVQLAGNPIE
jgi:hypothetical protein